MIYFVFGEAGSSNSRDGVYGSFFRGVYGWEFYDTLELQAIYFRGRALVGFGDTILAMKYEEFCDDFGGRADNCIEYVLLGKME